ncbi:hypothetical protein [Cutibacterium sp.]|uniref:hypothetical protein n=1 Tax=Cutibacterium sp. TaxID=1912221 RepID=UPI0026DC7677|nr:hypothetical protein [Cutibacterium sp.]MDO4413044.1 hypothetical protein [Cutibacterium sp.]
MAVAETWEWVDEAEALFYAFNEKLPEEKQMEDVLIDVGEESLALGGVAYSYEDLAMTPDAALMARLHALNEKYPFTDMVAVEERLAAIS